MIALLVVLTDNPARQQRQVQQAGTTRYDSIPGLPLDGIEPEARSALVKQLNHTSCSCDCNMTVAECRHKDPTCEHSLEMAKAALEGLKVGTSPAVSRP